MSPHNMSSPLRCFFALVAIAFLYRLLSKYSTIQEQSIPDEDESFYHYTLSETGEILIRAGDEEIHLLDDKNTSNLSYSSLHPSMDNHEVKSTPAPYADKHTIPVEPKPQITKNEGKAGKRALASGEQPISSIVSLARKIAMQYGFVTLQFFNRGYINITKSWVCNVKCMGVLPRVLFIATDHDALDGLATWNRELQVLLLPYDIGFKLSFGYVNYNRFILLRTWVILVLLQSNIPVALIESDAVWFDDALSVIGRSQGFDIVSVSNNVNGKGISGGFLYLNASTSTKTVWYLMFTEFKMRMDEQGHEQKEMLNSESEINTLRRVLQKNPVRIKTLPLENFVSGLWYTNATLREITKPIVIQVNYIVGVDTKISQAKNWGHWYLTEGGHCKDDSELLKCA